MKKISFFVAIAAAASLASCTAQAPKANMKNDVDSLSYMMGVANTQGLDMYLQQQGVDSTYMAEFLKGVTDGANKTSPKDVAYMVGLQVGQQVGGRMFDMMSQRLFGNDSTQSLDKANFLAGFVATLKKQNVMPVEEANMFVQTKGTLIDGTQFDSSYDRKEPYTTRANQVIKGWTEALTMMPVGSKWELYIPQELAYGLHGTGQIKPFSALIFEVELIDIEK